MENGIQLQSSARTVRRKDRQGRDSRAQARNGARASCAAGSDVTCSAAYPSAARGAIMSDIPAAIATIRLGSRESENTSKKMISLSTI